MLHVLHISSKIFLVEDILEPKYLKTYTRKNIFNIFCHQFLKPCIHDAKTNAWPMMQRNKMCFPAHYLNSKSRFLPKCTILDFKPIKYWQLWKLRLLYECSGWKWLIWEMRSSGRKFVRRISIIISLHHGLNLTAIVDRASRTQVCA